METIRECAKRAAEALPAFYLEEHYQNVLAHFLRPDFEVSLEVPVPLTLECGFLFGMGRMDIVAKCKITNIVYVLELKANLKMTTPNVDRARGQIERYLRHTDTPDAKGVLIFFGLHNNAHRIIAL